MTVGAREAEPHVAKEDPWDRDPGWQVEPDDDVSRLNEVVHAPDVCALDDPLRRSARRELAAIDVEVVELRRRGTSPEQGSSCRFRRRR